MKNLTRTLFAAVITAVVLTSSAVSGFASTKSSPELTVARSKAGFKRIWVSGNVKLVLRQGDVQKVVSTNEYDTAKLSVTTNGQTLYIKSDQPGLVTLDVTVKDLERLSAYGHSLVVTSNNFDVKYLQVFLHENAHAKIKTTAKSLYTVVNGDAKLKLDGRADQSTMVAANMKNVKLNDFACSMSESYASEAIMNAGRTAMNRTR